MKEQWTNGLVRMKGAFTRRKRLALTTLTIMLLFGMSVGSAAIAAPVLNFSDIDSGPKTGNTDGVGSGAIVTIWGNNLGSTQGTSKVYIGSAEATAVYYWKNADGSLPGGPSDLYTYHKMQEIAFAVPAGASDGATTIKVIVNGASSNTLPFTVRAGNIKFIKTTGSDSNSGTWSSPYLTWNTAVDGSHTSVGDIVYGVGVASTAGMKIGGASGIRGTSSQPVAFACYPNTRCAISGMVPGGASASGSVVDNWYPASRNNSYVHLSKLSITASGNCSGSGSDNSCNGICVIPYNRIVGVEITGPTVYGGYGGAITGTNGVPAGGVYLGIYIHNYGYQSKTSGKNNYSYTYSDDDSTWTSPPYNGIGDSCTNCTSADRFQHLYYISNRANANGVPYEIGWNHLTNNPILHGIHIYDMGGDGWVGTMKVHHNVVKNQRGGAMDFSIPTSATTVQVYNNLIIYDTNTKLQGIPFRIVGSSTDLIYNNTIYGWHNASYFEAASDTLRNNIFYDTVGVDFIHSVGLPTSNTNNAYYSSHGAKTVSGAISSVTSDPLFTNASGGDFSLQSGSPLLNAGYNTLSVVASDFLGTSRDSTPAIGAFEGVSGGGGGSQAPAAPTNLKIAQ